MRNPQPSPFLQLPGELRNRVYEYASCEQAIAVSRAGSGKIKFMVEPHNYPTARRYPLSDLLVRTAICREIYYEAFNLPMRLNRFRLHHIDTVALFTSLTPPAQLAKVTRLHIGCASTTRFRSELLASNLAKLTGVTHVTVETRHWLHRAQDSEDVAAAWRKGHRILLMECFGDFIEIDFEQRLIKGDVVGVVPSGVSQGYIYGRI
jgi:hypothetical protein